MRPTLVGHIRVADEGVDNVRHGPDHVFRSGCFEDGIGQVVQSLFKIPFLAKAVEWETLENQLEDFSEGWMLFFIDHQWNQILVVQFAPVSVGFAKKVLNPRSI